MLAFCASPEFRDTIVDNIRSHIIEVGAPCDYFRQPEDQSRARQFGCPGDCLLHLGTYVEIEQQVGIPPLVLCLNESIQLGFHKDDKREVEDEPNWQIRFVESIKSGADLSHVGEGFVEFLLTNKKFGLLHTLRKEENQAMAKQLVAELSAPDPDIVHLQSLRRRFFEFNDRNPDPGRMSSEAETAIAAIDFILAPSSYNAEQMLMQAGAQFQYGQKGKSWKFMMRSLRDEFIRLIETAPVGGCVDEAASENNDREQMYLPNFRLVRKPAPPAYGGSNELKDQILKTLDAHNPPRQFDYRADLRQQRGCPSNCGLHTPEFIINQFNFGVPLELSFLELHITGAVFNKDFSYAFFNAIRPSACLDPVVRDYVIWLFTDAECGLSNKKWRKQVKDIVAEVMNAYVDDVVDESHWRTLRTKIRPLLRDFDSVYPDTYALSACARLCYLLTAPWGVSSALYYWCRAQNGVAIAEYSEQKARKKLLELLGSVH